MAVKEHVRQFDSLTAVFERFLINSGVLWGMNNKLDLRL